MLETLFERGPNGAGTRLAFTWYVRVTNPVLNLLGYVAGRVYRHSHDSVMKEGESGLRDYCRRNTPAAPDDPPCAGERISGGGNGPPGDAGAYECDELPRLAE